MPKAKPTTVIDPDSPIACRDNFVEAIDQYAESQDWLGMRDEIWPLIEELRIAALAPAEPAPLSPRARAWADAIVTTVPVEAIGVADACGSLSGSPAAGVLAEAARDVDIIAAVNAARQRLTPPSDTASDSAPVSSPAPERNAAPMTIAEHHAAILRGELSVIENVLLYDKDDIANLSQWQLAELALEVLQLIKRAPRRSEMDHLQTSAYSACAALRDAYA